MAILATAVVLSVSSLLSVTPAGSCCGGRIWVLVSSAHPAGAGLQPLAELLLDCAGWFCLSSSATMATGGLCPGQRQRSSGCGILELGLDCLGAEDRCDPGSGNYGGAIRRLATHGTDPSATSCACGFVREETPMKILAVYGSNYGQAQAVLQRITAVLEARGHTVSVFKGDTIPEGLAVEDFDAVVVAASIIIGRYQAYIRDFVRRHGAALRPRRSFR
jgi:hypothetical protein